MVMAQAPGGPRPAQPWVLSACCAWGTCAWRSTARGAHASCRASSQSAPRAADDGAAARRLAAGRAPHLPVGPSVGAPVPPAAQEHHGVNNAFAGPAHVQVMCAPVAHVPDRLVGSRSGGKAHSPCQGCCEWCVRMRACTRLQRCQGCCEWCFRIRCACVQRCCCGGAERTAWVGHVGWQARGWVVHSLADQLSARGPTHKT